MSASARERFAAFRLPFVGADCAQALTSLSRKQAPLTAWCSTWDIVLVEHLVGHPGERVAREYGEQLPAEVERGLDAAVLIHALGDELLFELVAELQAELVALGELILAYDRGKAAGARDLGIAREELVREVRVSARVKPRPCRPS